MPRLFASSMRSGRGVAQLARRRAATLGVHRQLHQHAPAMRAEGAVDADSWRSRVAMFETATNAAKQTEEGQGPGLSANIQAGVDRVKRQLEQSNEAANSAIVPWFLSNMPPSYFYQTHRTAQIRHLRAMSALYGAGAVNPNLTIFSDEDDELFMIRPGIGSGIGSEQGELLTIWEDLARDHPGKTIQRVKKYTALDHTVSLINFKFAKPPQFDPESDEGQAAVQRLTEYAHEVRDGVYAGDTDHVEYCDDMSDQKILEYCGCCSKPYVERNVNARRFFKQMLNARGIFGTEGTRADVEAWNRGDAQADDRADVDHGGVPFTKRWFVDVSSANVLPQLYLHKVVSYLNAQGLTTRRVHFDTVRDPTVAGSTCSPSDQDGDLDSGTGSGVSHIRLLVADLQEATRDGDLKWDRITEELRRLKWLDQRVVELNTALGLDFARCEVLSALGSMLHGPLHNVNPHLYSRERIFHLMCSTACAPHTAAVAELFLQRFDPDGSPLSAAACEQRAEELREEIRADNGITRDDHVELLHSMIASVLAVQKTNYFVKGRYALSCVLEPGFMGVNPVIGDDTPFGTFFVHGRRFNAFHVRFRDIARGGLRVVNPRNMEMHGHESARHYREAYSLAFAQQLKNKDIPEGGSKGVLLIEPRSANSPAGNFVLRKSVKAFTEAMIDLIHHGVDERRPDKDTRISKHLRAHEDHIYFGPDENITTEDLEWITHRAEMRGHPMARALISSKPDAGINHKVYGVTSEGVNVMLDEALRSRGLDPTKQAFTVKITGGTDGDVAGNMIRFMVRDYGENVRVVAICDATATAEHPEGLDMGELMRLVESDLPVAEYQGCGELSVIATGGADAIAKRDSMAFRVKADVFVPAGGRPATITAKNCEQFLLPDGTPSSPLVVEGANLFIDPAARQILFDKAGVMFVRDASANKCGVISSSYEIMACMLLSKEEFIEYKEEMVEDVLTNLRHLARTEAKLLFREQANDPSVALPVVSTNTSAQITRVHDAVVGRLGSMEAEERATYAEEFESLCKQHLPATLARFTDRIPEKVPPAYVDALIAASLSSRLVYEEGIEFTTRIPDELLAEKALLFLREKEAVARLIEQVCTSDLPEAEREKIASLLRQGGVRSGLEGA